MPETTSLEQKRFWIHGQYMSAKLDGDILGMRLWEKNLKDLEVLVKKFQAEPHYGRRTKENKKLDLTLSYRAYGKF
jgi:hypothetical protein